MKVYVLTAGEYSDYHIVGVFSSLELLEATTARMTEREKGELNSPNEYDLDEMVGHEPGGTWEASIYLDTGGIPYVQDLGVKTRHPERCVILIDGDLITVMSPISGEHAAKVVVEKRQEWLRERAAINSLASPSGR